MKHLAIIVAVIVFNISAGELLSQTVRSVSPNISTPAFSPVLEVGDTVYVSGTLGRSAQTGKESTEQEAHVMLDSIQRALTRIGLTMDDLVSVQVFCTDLKEYDTFNGVYRTYFHTTLPARAFVGVNQLLFGAHFEMMGVATRDAASLKRAEPKRKN